MTALEKIRAWIASYPGYDILSHFRVDYTDQVPANGGIFPAGLVEVSRRTDILGNTEVTNQLNFSIHTVFAKGDETSASVNAEWVAAFQLWVQEQSITRQAPVFGDIPQAERIVAQNGVMFEADEEGTATYMVQLSATYVKRFTEEI